MAISSFMAAVNQIADEKGIDRDIVIETVESAVAAAYRKDYGHPDDVIRAKFEDESENIDLWQIHTVVADDEIESSHSQITLTEARTTKPDAEIGDEITTPLEPKQDFGRIAAQTAKQVIVQRIREAEREMLYQEFKEKEHRLVTGSIQQIEGDTALVNLGKINGLLLPSDQIPGESYRVGQRVKVFVTGVEETLRGPKVLVSRTHPGLIGELFAQEVPEIQANSVEIKVIAREAGSRTKIAVAATQPGVDPVGSAVGQRGARVQAVLAELGSEKIDIVAYDDDPIIFITNALQPAKSIADVKLFEDTKKALVSLPEDQLSLAIGRAGQNVRLASRLTGWSIDIAETGHETEKLAEMQKRIEEAESAKPVKTNVEAANAAAEEAITTGEHAVAEAKETKAPTDEATKTKPKKTTKKKVVEATDDTTA